MNTLPVVTSLVLTCAACPTQYDAFLEDGSYVYIRYRWGTLRAEWAISQDAWWSDQMKDLFCESVGEALDGFMEESDIKRHLSGVLDFSRV